MSETTAAPQHTAMGRVLDVIERAGNKVPHPVLMFLYLIIGVIVLSAVLAFLNVSVTDEIAVPDAVEVVPDYYEDSTQPILEPDNLGYEDDWHIEEVTIPIVSLLSTEGVRFIFTSFVPNFAGFGVVAVTFVALMGAGVAEAGGLMGALIRLLVGASPRRLLAFILIFVGVLSSVASDAGYLILVPLGAAAFVSVGRHPLAGMAACFAGVGAIFTVNPILTPIDAMLTEITNEAIGTVASGTPLTIVANYWFSIASSIVLAVVAAIVTERVIEPRLGPYAGEAAGGTQEDLPDPAANARGLRYALFGFVGFLALVLFITIPEGAPLREPVTGDIIGATPFMDSLLFIIAMFFLVSGIGYGVGVGTFKSPNDVIAAVTKTFAEPRRPGLHAADDQPVHRLLQFQQPAERSGDRVGRGPRGGRHRRPAAPHRDDHRDHAPGRDHPRRRPEVGHLRANLHPAVHPARDPAADRPRRLPGWRLAPQRGHAPDGVLAVHGDGGPAVPEGCRDRHDHRVDAALRRVHRARLDRAVHRVVPGGSAARSGISDPGLTAWTGPEASQGLAL